MGKVSLSESNEGGCEKEYRAGLESLHFAKAVVLLDGNCSSVFKKRKESNSSLYEQILRAISTVRFIALLKYMKPGWLT